MTFIYQDSGDQVFRHAFELFSYWVLQTRRGAFKLYGARGKTIHLKHIRNNVKGGTLAKSPRGGWRHCGASSINQIT